MMYIYHIASKLENGQFYYPHLWAEGTVFSLYVCLLAQICVYTWLSKQAASLKLSNLIKKWFYKTAKFL